MIEQIQIDWFIVSKQAMDQQDYRILGGSIAQTETWRLFMNNWIKDEIPYEATPHSPGAPCFYFIPQEIDGLLKQVIIRQIWTDYVDNGSRRVLTTTCLILPYEVFNKHPCGFKQQAALFDLPEVSQRLLATQVAIRNGEILLSQPTLKVELPTFEETENYFLERLSAQGLDFTQVVANALTRNKNVCIWDRNDTIVSLEQRLEWLDAALISLPYGARSTCPAASWQNTYREDGDRLVVGRKANPTLSYVSPGEDVDGVRLCEGYAAAVTRLLGRGKSAADLVKSFLRQAEPIDINGLRYGPPQAEPINSQERLLQMLTDPEAYSSRESLRVLIEEIKQTNPQEVESEHIRKILVRAVPALETRDANLIKAYWSEALLTQSLASLNLGYENIIQLLPALIPYDLDERKLSKVFEKLLEYFSRQPNTTDSLHLFFDSLHRFFNDRYENGSMQLNQGFHAIKELILKSRSGSVAILIWIHFVLAPDSKYKENFFNYFANQQNLPEPLPVFTRCWLQNRWEKMMSSLQPYAILPLAKISLIRNRDQRETAALLEILRHELTARNPETTNVIRPELYSALLLPYLNIGYWSDYPQDGIVGAMLMEINFLVRKRWDSIFTLKPGDEHIQSFSSELSRFKNNLTLTGQRNSAVVLEIQATIDVVQHKSCSNIDKMTKPNFQSSITMQTMEQIEYREVVQVKDDREDEMTRETPIPDPKNLSSTELTLREIAQSAAGRIETARNQSDVAVWHTIVSQITHRTPSLEPQELEQFLLLMLGSIQDGGVRKETLTNMLPILYAEYSSSTDLTKGETFFQAHSEFVSDVLKSYVNAFSQSDQYDQWWQFFDSLRESAQEQSHHP